MEVAVTHSTLAIGPSHLQEKKVKLRLWVTLVFVALSVTPSSFGLIAYTTGTATCNGSNVSLNYNNSFIVDVLSVSGASVGSVTCQGGAAIYALSGSQFTITFGAPIIGSDVTSYSTIGQFGSYPQNGLTNYQGHFNFVDVTTGQTFYNNYIGVSTNSTSETGLFSLANSNTQIVFDPPGSELVIWANPADIPSPSKNTPEPDALLLLSSGIGALAIRRRSAK